MKLVSWNVAGFRACLNKGFKDFFNEINPDIVCLQEVKATKEEYDFHPEGYFEYLSCAEKKGYSGTLIYSKIKPINVTYGLGIDMHDHEGRLITLEFDNFYLINSYVPNVKRDLSRLDERMIWEDDFRKYINDLAKKKDVIMCGDLNVAHTEMDIKNAKRNRGHAGFTDEERAKFSELLESGFIDTYRSTHPDKTDAYTWWSYMGNARAKNVGWRLDYFLVNKNHKLDIDEAIIYNEVYGSDHCPIGLNIK